MIKRTHILASAFMALAIVVSTGRATPPPENKPQYCAMTFCVEVIAYSFVESAVVDRTDRTERISLRLRDGTRIAFAARAFYEDETIDQTAQSWDFRSPSLAVARQCIGCSDQDVPSLIVGAAVSGDPSLVQTHLKGSLCVWSSRYRWRSEQPQPRRIELGERECFQSIRQ